ncbi:hypothetical protein [Modestobacter marinus]|uniref:hypothetical protein n=1 Tax=Modestobacter marinus TaxID=477641 RepID=UPI001C971750|nr:hypothetical protein [Modestobacter marinus]
MFGGGGFGVAVTVVPVSVLPAGDEPPVPVVRRRPRLTEVLHPAGVVDAGLVGELAAIADVRAQLAAYEAGVVVAFAARRVRPGCRPARARGRGWLPDPPPVGVSEFFADELAAITRSSRAAAVGLAERALVWVRELPATWHALADGLIDEPRARAIAAALGGQSTDAGGVVDPAVVAEVQLGRWVGRSRGRPRCGGGSGRRRR